MAKGDIKKSRCEINLENGMGIYESHDFFKYCCAADFIYVKNNIIGKDAAATVESNGKVYLNVNYDLSPQEWAFVIAHCVLHLAFGHFDADKMPGYEDIGASGKKQWHVSCKADYWNLACDIYIAKFLADIKFGVSPNASLASVYHGPVNDERIIYQYLLDNGKNSLYFGTAGINKQDMIGLKHPIVYAKNQANYYAEQFARAIVQSVSNAVARAGHHLNRSLSDAERAAQWFLNHYPLLGGLATGFRILDDTRICYENDISVAAVDVDEGIIYVNSDANLTFEELKFVLAHEYLHAGLQHYERIQGRDPFLWNVACDYVINGWLVEMEVGAMPPGALFDTALRGQSAEEIYDTFIKDLKKIYKLKTFRNIGKGDIMGGHRKGGRGRSLDDFYRSALMTGLEYHKQADRGFVPAGLIEEIKALAMPPVPWDVKLGMWFDEQFPPPLAKYSYARPSRRQGSTPDIPRPRCVKYHDLENSRTFGVVIDTSGSMSAKLIGYALGAAASYASAKEVPCARVVFCDADAYDEGYMAPDEIAGRVEVKGRGGTILQPAVDLLIKARDFPKTAPILIITDGFIEANLKVHREHAFLLPQGASLPFRPSGKVFHFKEKC